MSFIKIKNRSQHAIVLHALDGDSVQVNAQAIVKVDDKFLVDYDRMQIQVLELAPKVPQEVIVPVKESKPESSSKKKEEVIAVQ
jgi:hypothetical protein